MTAKRTAAADALDLATTDLLLTYLAGDHTRVGQLAAEMGAPMALSGLLRLARVLGIEAYGSANHLATRLRHAAIHLDADPTPPEDT